MIFISFVVAILIFSFIAKNYFVQIEALQYFSLKQIINNTYSGVVFLMESDSKSDFSSWTEIEKLTNDQITTEGKVESWGGYALVFAKSHWKNLSNQKAALTGARLFADEKIGLYLAEKDNYLSISGDARLTGVTYLPKLGIRSVYIDGKPYSGEKLLYGSQKTSNSTLPELKDDFVQKIQDFCNGYVGDSIGKLSDLYKTDNIEQPFYAKSLLFSSAQTITLENIKLEGKIIIHSESRIIVENTASCEDIILTAPIVIINKEFKGTLQIIASDSVYIDEEVTLEYPSMIAVYNNKSSKSFCYLDEQSTVSGAVLCGSGLKNGTDAELYLEENALVNGLCYTSGDVQHKGNVQGTLYANQFVLKTSRGFYENHLLDGVVDPESQYENLGIPGCIENTNTQGCLIKWY